ncbi:MAG: helix-turn-helix transcriptional regulator [Clostridia bacterium]|nr:helix-turn-helix transcriptional regulator [Clostridia bacterium]
MKLNYGEALKEQRKIRNLTQMDLEKATNIPQSTISAYEKNINSPNIDILVTLADFYDISVDELIGRK